MKTGPVPAVNWTPAALKGAAAALKGADAAAALQGVAQALKDVAVALTGVLAPLAPWSRFVEASGVEEGPPQGLTCGVKQAWCSMACMYRFACGGDRWAVAVVSRSTFAKLIRSRVSVMCTAIERLWHSPISIKVETHLIHRKQSWA